MITKETERAKEKKDKQNNNKKKHRKGAHRRSKYPLRGSKRVSNDVLMLSSSKTLRLRYPHHLMLARYRDLVLWCCRPFADYNAKASACSLLSKYRPL